MLSTSLLTLNMPQLISEYGSRQFDVITSLDQHKVLAKDHQHLLSGFSINEKGIITGTLSFVSLLKVAPADLKKPKFYINSLETEEDEDDDQFEINSR